MKRQELFEKIRFHHTEGQLTMTIGLKKINYGPSQMHYDPMAGETPNGFGLIELFNFPIYYANLNRWGLVQYGPQPIFSKNHNIVGYDLKNYVCYKS